MGRTYLATLATGQDTVAGVEQLDGESLVQVSRMLHNSAYTDHLRRSSKQQFVWPPGEPVTGAWGGRSGLGNLFYSIRVRQREVN
jgi:hypothetical protein